ncbi:MAG: DUF559 domain-containing protein [Gemmatimonadota bacterium]|nr:DUF559 domain-containing protein [Gemmatimonadota bacterium]
MKIYYNRKLKSLARELRKNSTLAEVLLWNQLKGRKSGGLQFARQKPIGEYIVDFFCPKLGLVIEIDGESHDNRQQEDALRQEYLESLGLHVVRFLDRDVKKDIQAVTKQLEQEISCIENEDIQPPFPPLVRGNEMHY